MNKMIFFDIIRRTHTYVNICIHDEKIVLGILYSVDEEDYGSYTCEVLTMDGVARASGNLLGSGEQTVCTLGESICHRTQWKLKVCHGDQGT